MLNFFRNKDKRTRAGPESRATETITSSGSSSRLSRRPALRLDLGVGRNLTRLLSSTSGVDHSAKPPCPTIQKSHSSDLEQSIKRIGTMFRRDTTASEMQGPAHDSSPGQDPTEAMIIRIRHVSGVASHSPTVVTPDRSSGGSFPPFEAGVVPEVAVAGNWEDEGSVTSEYSASNYSQASAPIDHSEHPFHKSSHDYLKVSIPDGTLSPPVDACEMLWTHKP